jgi:carbonic anhydrase
MKIAKALSLLALVVASLVGITSETSTPHWTYHGKEGHAAWGRLHKTFAPCSLGLEQSPIDISTKDVERADLRALRPAYRRSAGELSNTGHTIQISLSDGGTVSAPSGDYTIQQFHFHTPSEERIDGSNFPLVAHLVHQDAQGRLAVLGVLFRQGSENAALNGIFAALPDRKGKVALSNPFDPSALLPASMGYYAFKGSLTTPPCSEGIDWYVLKTPLEASAAQIEAFQTILKMNARPVQPLNHRKVREAG